MEIEVWGSSEEEASEASEIKIIKGESTAPI